MCEDCPFKTICCPGVSFGPELKISDDTMFETRLRKYLALKTASEECDAIYEVIRDEAKAQAGAAGELNLMVGDVILTGKRDSKGSFRLKIEKI